MEKEEAGLGWVGLGWVGSIGELRVRQGVKPKGV